MILWTHLKMVILNAWCNVCYGYFFLLRSATFPCRIPVKSTQQDFAVSFVLIADEAGAQKKIAESAVLVLGSLLLCRGEFLSLAHFAESCNEPCVGGHGIGIRCKRKPRKVDGYVRHFVGKAFCHLWCGVFVLDKRSVLRKGEACQLVSQG